MSTPVEGKFMCTHTTLYIELDTEPLGSKRKRNSSKPSSRNQMVSQF